MDRKPAGTPAGGQFASGSHEVSPIILHAPTMDVVDTNYRGSHRAPRNDDYCRPLDRLAESFGADVYDHPEFHGSGECDAETMAQLLATRGNPDATVTIYRAVPPGVDSINAGDWVSLSRGYAEQHAMQDDDEDNDWPVIEQRVPASTVFTDGNDLAEFGYDPPAAPVHPAMEVALAAAAARGDEHDVEATRAVIGQTARGELLARFTASELSADELGAKVGHSPRIASRVVAGKEPLSESTVAAYFRAMSGPRPQ